MESVQEILERNAYFENHTHLVDVDGMSTPRVCGLLNQLVRRMRPDDIYLEIGTWKGLTICSAAIDNVGKRCIACDKFRTWGWHTGWGGTVRRELYRNIERYADRSAHVTFFQMTSEDLFRRNLVPPHVAVYFYDGDHSYDGTYKNLVAAGNLLKDESVLLVDDWNDPEIRIATERAIADMGFGVAARHDLEGENGSQTGWWNGLGVFEIVRKRH